MAKDILTLTFIRLRGRLHAAARSLLGDESEADDALQEAFYKLWSRRQTIVSQSQAEGMSVVAVRNTCIDTLRRNSRTRGYPIDEALDTFDDTDSERERIEQYETVKAIIDSRLSERERSVITMRDTMDMDYTEIAEELGISENNVRMIVSRARTKVREIYLSSKKNEHD